MTDNQRTYAFRPARGPDAPAVAQLVDAAYGHYVDRIGMLPGPMTDDYEEVIRNHQVIVAESDGVIVAVLVLAVTAEGFLVNNVAVHPSRRGTGLGRALLELAEAEAGRAGFESLYLYTHEKMTENLSLYGRIGYVEYDRRSQGRLLPGLPAEGPRGGVTRLKVRLLHLQSNIRYKVCRGWTVRADGYRSTGIAPRYRPLRRSIQRKPGPALGAPFDTFSTPRRAAEE